MLSNNIDAVRDNTILGLGAGRGGVQNTVRIHKLIKTVNKILKPHRRYAIDYSLTQFILLSLILKKIDVSLKNHHNDICVQS